MKHTQFDIARIQETLSSYISQGLLPPVQGINSYNDWCQKIPVLDEKGYSENVEHMLSRASLESCSFSMSSASAGIPKLIPQRLWRTITPKSYPYQLAELLAKKRIFTRSDCVANLFTAGGLSTLYDGCNRLLEGCKTSILPVGRLDKLGDNKRTIINLMSRLPVNTLFGTPSSFVQCIQASQQYKEPLFLEKIVFTGEVLSENKRNYIESCHSAIQIFGLYGHSETGFIGFNTPRCLNNHYHMLDENFFIEITDTKKILVTDLILPILPLIRYSVGDIGELIPIVCACGDTSMLLKLEGRHDKKFNYMGNLISFSFIKSLVESVYKNSVGLQIQLTTNEAGHDFLSIVIDIDASQLNSLKSKILSKILQYEEINEGLRKGAGTLFLLSKEKLQVSDRQKIPMIVDTR